MVGFLGEGSFGRVFKVKKAGTFYAMKSMKKADLSSKGEMKYAVSELSILKQFDHPFILRLQYAFQTPLYLHMVMEVCEGGDLGQHLVKM